MMPGFYNRYYAGMLTTDCPFSDCMTDSNSGGTSPQIYFLHHLLDRLAEFRYSGLLVSVLDIFHHAGFDVVG